MLKICVRFGVIALLLMSSDSLMYATHIMGGEITYTWMGGNQYLFRVTLYRDCNGVLLPLSIIMRLQSSVCGQNFTVSLPLVAITEVSQVCPSYIPLTTCNGGNLPGVQRGVYETIVNLPTNCPDWVFYITAFARNNAITNLVNPGSHGLLTYTTLDNLNFTYNNSVFFSGSFMPYVCASNTTIYSLGPVDPDADSLRVMLEPALDAPYAGPPTYGTPIPYNTGLSYQNPLNSYIPIQFDSLTGTMCFNPFPNQFAVVAFRVQEYRGGSLVAETHREVQIVVYNCTGSNPNSPRFTGDTTSFLSCQTSGGCIDSVEGAFLMGCNTIFACKNIPFTFYVSAHDPDSILGQQIYMGSNATTALPGASFTTSYVGGNMGHIVGTVTWTPTTAGSYTVLFTVSDSACAIPRESSMAVYIYVIEDTAVKFKFLGDSVNLGWGPVPAIVEGCTDAKIVFYVDSSLTDTFQREIIIKGSWDQSDFGNYVPGSYMLTFTPGDTLDTLSFSLIQDGISEPIETLSIWVVSLCDTVHLLDVLLVDSPSVRLPFNDTVLCSPADLTIRLEELNSAYVQWLVVDPITGSLCNGYPYFGQCDSLTLTVDTSYTLVVTASTGSCVAADTLRIILSKTSVALSPDTIICLHDTACVAMPTEVPGPWQDWVWSYEGNAIYGAPSVCIEGSAPVELILTAVDTFGCVRSDTMIIGVDSTAWVSLIAEDTVLLQGATTTLTGYTTAPLFWWDPSDGIVDTTSLQTTVMPDSTTTYYLWIQSAIGCLRADSVRIIVIIPEECGEGTILVPNTFTPNGDGLNDVLYVYSQLPLQIISFRIYDRWGNLIFEVTEDAVDIEKLHNNRGWDGTLPDGTPARPDVYVWTLEAICPLPPYNKIFYRGDVTLIR